MNVVDLVAIVIVIASLLVLALTIWATSRPRSYIPFEARVVHAVKRVRNRDYRAHIELEIQQQAGCVVVTHRDDTRSWTSSTCYPVRAQTKN